MIVATNEIEGYVFRIPKCFSAFRSLGVQVEENADPLFFDFVGFTVGFSEFSDFGDRGKLDRRQISEFDGSRDAFSLRNATEAR